MILKNNPAKLKEVLDTVLTSPHSHFYQDKYKNIPVTVQTPLEKIPTLTRHELSNTEPFERLYVERGEVSFTAHTSGTSSGMPLVSSFTQVDSYFFEPSLGLPIERPLITYPPLNKNFAGTFIQQCRQANRKVTPVFGDLQNLANSAVLASVMQVDAIYATPTIALLLAPYIATHYNPRAIKLLALSSETLTHNQKQQLKVFYPESSVANLYASSEIGQYILFPCPAMINEDVDEFHILEEALVAAELIENQLVVTYGLNKALPLIRYETGDHFEIGREQCTCGRTGKTLRWLGRENVDRVRFDGYEITVDQLDTAFAKSPVASHIQYQAHFFHEKPDTPASIIFEIQANSIQQGSDHHSIALLIKDSILDDLMVAEKVSLRSALKRNLFSSVDVKIIKNFSLTGQKTRKIVNHIK